MYGPFFKAATVLFALCLISAKSHADTTITIDNDGNETLTGVVVRVVPQTPGVVMIGPISPSLVPASTRPASQLWLGSRVWGESSAG